jgi:hypothetical protein
VKQADKTFVRMGVAMMWGRDFRIRLSSSLMRIKLMWIIYVAVCRAEDYSENHPDKQCANEQAL